MIHREIYAAERLILRFDYEGAKELLIMLEWEGQPIHHLVLSCQRNLGFNFASAKSLTDQVADVHFEHCPGLIRHRDELPALIEGRPHEIFNELVDNIIIRLEREAYTDFLGRIFQIRELLFKYAVIQFKLKEEYSLRNPIYQKRVFERRFKLRYGLLNGMKSILRTAGGRWSRVVNILAGKQMNELMDIRHKTIVAHGIETVTKEDIIRIYGSPKTVLRDLHQVFELLEIPIRSHKYKGINEELIQKILGKNGNE